MTKPNGKQRLYNQPLVSICVPIYNAEKTVMSTLQSILNQTYHNLELLVVDNASTDNTLGLLQQINDHRLVIHRNERNIGGEANYSKCIGLANGEYIAVFHADDLYMPNMVEKQVQAFQDNPSVGAVFTLANLINEKGKVIAEAKLPVKLRGKGIYYLPEIFISILENGNFLMCPSCMVRGKLYKELVPLDVDRFGTSDDLDMWLRMLEKHPVAILDEKLMSYRLSNRKESYQLGNLRTEQADFFKVMDYHLGVKSSLLDIPSHALNKYEFQRSKDNFWRAENYVIKKQPQEAKKLLKESFSATVFWGVIGNIRTPGLLVYWIFDIMIMGLVYLGLGRYLGKGLHWWLYTWKRRMI